MTVDPANEARVVDALRELACRAATGRAPPRPWRALRKAAAGTGNLMAATMECARAGVTTGEWAGACARSSASSAPPRVSAAPRSP